MSGMAGRGPRSSKAVREFKASGNKAMQSGGFQKAMRLYTKALEIDAGNAILYSNRSAAHFNVRQFAESLEDAESAILCDTMWWKAYKRKGLALIHMQRYEEAIQALEEGLKIVGKNAEMEKNLEFARACQEQAQNLYILPEPHMMERLESVPVFIVTDNLGQPFFVTYDDGQQVCTFYFDQEDAKSTLEWIKSENPDLGDTARVINITLHQAFNLAQETQKQYYEETTRAAAEEDRAAAAAAKEGGQKAKEEVKNDANASDKNSDDWETDAPCEGDDVKEDATKNTSTTAGGDDESTRTNISTSVAKGSKTDVSIASKSGTSTDVKNATKGESQGTPDEGKDWKKTEETGEAEKKEDDAVIDESAPLSFQFRPELRQVKVAVELLNKNPNPPVRPILREPPVVRKARSEWETTESLEETEGAKDANKQEDETECGATKCGATQCGATECGATASAVEKADGDVAASGDDDDKKEEKATDVGDEDVELTVDNFNGIPIFQAKGLTLLQKNKQLIPLFFSKWDLEAAWKQLKESNSIDVPGECEIDVGTLEDVLRRMSESKTDEFESVFFVPSRESMKAINVKFPLDELSPPSTKAGLSGKGGMKKAVFSKAKQIAARGGTKDEVRAAIREDLEKHAERQKIAEVLAQIEQARRTGGMKGVGLGSGGGGTSGGGAKSNGTGIKT